MITYFKVRFSGPGSTKVQTALKHDPTGHFPGAGLVPKKVTPYIYCNVFTITSCARIVETPFQGIPYPIAGQTQMRFKRFCIPFYHQDITPEWLVCDVFCSVLFHHFETHRFISRQRKSNLSRHPLLRSPRLYYSYLRWKNGRGWAIFQDCRDEAVVDAGEVWQPQKPGRSLRA